VSQLLLGLAEVHAGHRGEAPEQATGSGYDEKDFH
jgi:hypothetical protein